MVTDAQRRELYTALRDHLGSGPAEVMMELLPPVGWADVARRADISQLDGRISQLDGRISQLEGRIAAQLPRLIAANLAGGFATAGLVLTAARVA